MLNRNVSLEIQRLPRCHRCVTHHAMRLYAGAIMGFLIMYLGAYMANIEPMLPRPLWETIAFFVHGFGALPLYAHGEGLWRLLIPPIE